MPSITYLKTKDCKLKHARKALNGVSDVFRVKCPSSRKFGQVLGISGSTAWKRLDEPGSLTLDEVIRASVELGYEGSLVIKNGDISAEVRW